MPFHHEFLLLAVRSIQNRENLAEKDKTEGFKPLYLHTQQTQRFGPFTRPSFRNRRYDGDFETQRA